MDDGIQSLLQKIDTLGKDLVSSDAKQAAEKRSKLRLAARQISLALEEPGDVVERVCFQFMETANIRNGINLDLFRILVESDGPKSASELANITKADPVLLGRILRGLASVGAVGEVEKDTYTPTTVSRTFAKPSLAAGVEWCFDFLSPIWNHIPSWLAQTKYQNPTNIAHTAFHITYRTAEEMNDFIAHRPQYSQPFQRYMSAFYEGRANWMDFFPVEEKLGDGAREDRDAVLFVDVGGGMGHEASALRKRFPKLPGRYVLQDLPAVVSQVQTEGVEVMGHNFFEPQPMKGARAYYLRNILHDWSDDGCLRILRPIRLAMDPKYSKLLINQWVIPAQGATSFMTHQDFNMMAVYAGMERTEQQWNELLGNAGFKIEKIWSSDDAASECLIEAVVSV